MTTKRAYSDTTRAALRKPGKKSFVTPAVEGFRSLRLSGTDFAGVFARPSGAIIGGQEEAAVRPLGGCGGPESGPREDIPADHPTIGSRSS